MNVAEIVPGMEIENIRDGYRGVVGGVVDLGNRHVVSVRWASGFACEVSPETIRPRGTSVPAPSSAPLLTESIPLDDHFRTHNGRQIVNAIEEAATIYRKPQGGGVGIHTTAVYMQDEQGKVYRVTGVAGISMHPARAAILFQMEAADDLTSETEEGR